MRSRALIVLCVALACISLFAVCAAAGDTTEITGTVVKVDIRSAKSETPVGPDGKFGKAVMHLDMSFDVQDDAGKVNSISWGDPMEATKVFDKDGKPGLPRDIKKGGKVTVTADKSAKGLVAKEIHLQ
jgi:Cu/Ag efflux protein CusF